MRSGSVGVALNLRCLSDASSKVPSWRLARGSGAQKWGQVCPGRWRFRHLQHRNAHGMKSEQNSGAEFWKTHVLATPAPCFSWCAPDTLSQAPSEAAARARETQPTLQRARPHARAQAGREPPTGVREPTRAGGRHSS